MRISDWSSDVCSSDLLADKRLRLPALTGAVAWPSWADHEIVVAGAHRARISGRMAAAIRAGIDFTQFSESAAGRLILRADKKSAPNQPHGPRQTAVLLSGHASLLLPKFQQLPTDRIRSPPMMRKGAPARVMTVPGRKEGRTSGLDALRAQQPVRTFRRPAAFRLRFAVRHGRRPRAWRIVRSEEHTSELQSLMRISYAA